MTREQKIEALKGLSNEELMSELKNAMKDLNKEFSKENVENVNLIEAEVLSRMA